MERDEIVVTEEEEGMRLDVLLFSRFKEFSRAYFQKLIDQELVLVSGSIVKKRYLVKEGDEIEIEFLLTQETAIQPEPIPLAILYEDPYLIIVNKPKGMVVHPAPGNLSGTFASALLYHIQAERGALALKPGDVRPGIVHRLDKDTTGVLVGAKEERAHRLMVGLFATRKVEKKYLAITVGSPGKRLVEAPIGRHPTRRKEMAVQEEGRAAETLVETLATHEGLALALLMPKTGRTHQLRVHLQAIQTPILGDPIYGSSSLNRKYKVDRVLLHAYEIAFTHPILNQEIRIKAPLPEDFKLWAERIAPKMAKDF